MMQQIYPFVIEQRVPKSYPDVSDILYEVFPEAPSALYRLMIDSLYYQTTWIQQHGSRRWESRNNYLMFGS